ncbi:MAG: hypothetical protein FDZ70_11200 [Actinobacteria bacterium]|nr:MAG: hypothetical protein FDZ70_11200 [Actinomycetota bacterium]
MRLLETFAEVLGVGLGGVAVYLLFSRRHAGKAESAPPPTPAPHDSLAVGRLRGGRLAFVCALIVDIFVVVLLFAPAPTTARAMAVTLLMIALSGFAALITAAGVVAVAPALGHSPGTTAALAVLALLPAVSLVIILVMSAQSTAALRATSPDSAFKLAVDSSPPEPDPSDTWDAFD